MISQPPYPCLEISSANLRHNLLQFRQVIAASGESPKILLPVKANAYGCGIKAIMPFIQSSGIEWLGVANPFEGYELRQLGWQGPILNLGAFYFDHIELFFKYQITPTITDTWQVNALQQAGQPVEVHLKFDLGMGRLGIKEPGYHEVIENLKVSKQLKVGGIYTHFPNADRPEDNQTLDQIAAFDKLYPQVIDQLGVERNQVLVHAANSYATVQYPQAHYDMVRPGLLFYGYYQSLDDMVRLKKDFDVKPALRLKAKPISLRHLKEGDSVSYGSAFTANHDMKVAVMPLGYADGIPRKLGNQISFGEYPLLGNVTMDQVILGNVESQKDIDLLSEKTAPLEEWARLCCTTTYEMLTNLGSRLQRRLV